LFVGLFVCLFVGLLVCWFVGLLVCLFVYKEEVLGGTPPITYLISNVIYYPSSSCQLYNA
jgi:hypothetical protein